MTTLTGCLRTHKGGELKLVKAHSTDDKEYQRYVRHKLTPNNGFFGEKRFDCPNDYMLL
jgi:hypothetical protein